MMPEKQELKIKPMLGIHLSEMGKIEVETTELLPGLLQSKFEKIIKEGPEFVQPEEHALPTEITAWS